VIEDNGIRLATTEEKVRSDLKPAPRTDTKKPEASEHKAKDTKKSDVDKSNTEKPKSKKTVYKNPKAPGGKTLSLKK
jgi:hypothetical protein